MAHGKKEGICRNPPIAAHFPARAAESGRFRPIDEPEASALEVFPSLSIPRNPSLGTVSIEQVIFAGHGRATSPCVAFVGFC